MPSYNDIFRYDIELAYMIQNTYGSSEKAWEIFLKSYRDPDGFPEDGKLLKRAGDVKCSADGLLSVKRIYHFEGFGDAFIQTFISCRRTPILFFPKEKQSINILRSRLLEDRIDHALFDLKRFCEGATDCILMNAYQQPQTKAWLEYFQYDFRKIVNWFKIDGIFVNENYEIYDLEKKDRSTLTELKSHYVSFNDAAYLSSWSLTYYENVKWKISEFETKLRVK